MSFRFCDPWHSVPKSEARIEALYFGIIQDQLHWAPQVRCGGMLRGMKIWVNGKDFSLKLVENPERMMSAQPPWHNMSLFGWCFPDFCQFFWASLIHSYENVRTFNAKHGTSNDSPPWWTMSSALNPGLSLAPSLRGLAREWEGTSNLFTFLVNCLDDGDRVWEFCWVLEGHSMKGHTWHPFRVGIASPNKCTLPEGYHYPDRDKYFSQVIIDMFNYDIGSLRTSVRHTTTCRNGRKCLHDTLCVSIYFIYSIYSTYSIYATYSIYSILFILYILYTYFKCIDTNTSVASLYCHA